MVALGDWDAATGIRPIQAGQKMVLAIRDVGWNRKQIVAQDHITISPLCRNVSEAIGLSDFIAGPIYQMIENTQLIWQVGRPLE